jgi:site-specific DNA-methyltransferase (adenine-specific)
MAELTLHNGDCLEVMKTIPDKSIDLIICDLPYGCLSGRAIGKAAESKKCFSGASNGCDWDVKINLKSFWDQIKRIRKSDHSPCIHFCTTKFGYELIKSNESEFRYDLVWDKQRGVSFLSANKMPMRSHEMIYVFSKTGAYYERKDIEGDFPTGKGGRSRATFINAINTLSENKEAKAGRRCVKTVIPISTNLKKNQHPTEKPEALYRFLIERYCPERGVILDPTFGSGNSVFTAFDMGRSAIGVEKDVKFFEKAEERLNTL